MSSDNDKTIIYNSHCLKIFDDDNIPKKFNNFKSKCSRTFTLNDPKKRNIDFMYNLIPSNVKNDYN